jgi:hypothetical protein
LEVSDRGLLFLFSLCVIAGSLAVAVWLAATGQAAYVDGLFLLISCLVLALAFGLYIRYLIRSVAPGVPVTAPSKSKAAAPEKSSSRVPAETGELAGKAR